MKHIKSIFYFKSLIPLFVIFFLILPATVSADDSQTEADVSIEEIEGELVDQGLIEEPNVEEDAVAESSKAEKSKDKTIEKSAAQPAASTAVPVDPERSLKESIFSIGAHMGTPDISIKIGAAITNYSVQVPPGTNGMTPNVSLHYSSSQRNGIAGVGWNLKTDAITRSTKRGTCYSCTDFMYNGEELVTVSTDASGYGTYRPEQEQAFSVIEYLSNDSWSVTLKSGVKYTYGSNSTSKQIHTNGTFKWLLETIEDTNGNIITYTYTSDQGQIYLNTIDYAGYYTISFYYEQREDPIVSYISHENITTAKRLKTIAVENLDAAIRAYDLTYTQSFNTKRSLLTTITAYGSDYSLDTNNVIDGGSSLPSTQITYNHELTNFTPSPTAIDDFSHGQGYYSTYVNPVITGDFNGDGKTDVGRVEANSVKFYVSTGTNFVEYHSLPDFSPGHGYTNNNDYPIITGDWNGDGKTDVGRVKDAGINFYIATETGFERYTNSETDLSDLAKDQYYANQTEYPILTGDWNGDGKTDICRVFTDGVHFYTSTGSGFQVHTGISSFGKGLEYPNNGDYPIFTGDFNGDGRTDIARVSDSSIIIFVSTDSDFLNTTDHNLPALGKIEFENNQKFPIITGDFNGDGLTDIGRGSPNHVITYLSSGTGFVEIPQTTILYTDNNIEVTYNSNPIFTGDFNDDGLTDLGRVISNRVVFCMSKGTSFESYHPLSGIYDMSIDQHVFDPPAYYYQGVQGEFDDQLRFPIITGDFAGNGTTGIGRVSETNVVFYSPDVTDTKACDLASKFISTTGHVTDIEYTPSSEYNNTLLPFVLQTVSKITTDDGLGNISTTSYTFAGGLYDYDQREVKSFFEATKINPDGTKEITQFHQDIFLDARPIVKQFYASDDTLLSKSDYTWISTPYDSKSSFITLSSKIETLYENGNEIFLQEDYTYFETHGSIDTKTVSGTGLIEDAITAYEYAAYGTGAGYPLRTTKETLSGSVNGLVRQAEYTYDTKGNLTSKTLINTTGLDNPVTTYDYDNDGNVIRITDANWNETTYEYDDIVHTYAVKTIRPATGIYDHITQYPSVDFRYGKPLTFENENGRTITYTYDVFGRTRTINYPDGGQETYDYDDISMPRSVTKGIKDSAATSIDTISYIDGYGRTIQAVSKSKDEYAVSLFSFDDMGREECVKGPFFNADNTFLSSQFSGISSDPSTVGQGVVTTWARNYYDAKSRVIRIQQSGGINTYLAYDNLKTTITDPDGHSKTQITDILGRIIEVKEHGPTDPSTTYRYNIAGDLLEVTRINPATGNPIKNIITYNTLGQKKSMIDPDMGLWTYTYDLNGNLETQTDARNTTITFKYDQLNRQIKKIYPDASMALFEYDAAENGVGLLYKKSNANASTQITSYDTMGRPLSETRIIDTITIVFDYTYDIAGRQVSKAVTKDNLLFKTLAYEFYPQTSLLKAVKKDDNQSYTDITQYSPQGKIEFLNHFNTTVTNYIYDYSTGRIETIHSYNMSRDIIEKHYTYSNAGDVTKISNVITGIEYTYTYDHLHRLISELSSEDDTQPYIDIEIIEFTYADGPEAPVHAPVQTRINGVLTDYDYTSTGTRFNKNSGLSTTTYESNDDNMITMINIDGVETHFYYDSDSKRIKKTQGISSTLYFGPDFEVINNTPTLYVFAGNLRVAKITDTTLEYFHKDHLGSTNAISTEDGTVIDLGEYLPYGQDRDTNALLQTSSYKFTDQEQDAGTGLYNYDARLYDPVIGQFVMADTIVPDLFDPQRLNRYAYCLNNPVRYIDPSGHEPVSGRADHNDVNGHGAVSNYNGDGTSPDASPQDSIEEARQKMNNRDDQNDIIGYRQNLIPSYRTPIRKSTLIFNSKSFLTDPSGKIVGVVSTIDLPTLSGAFIPTPAVAYFGPNNTTALFTGSSAAIIMNMHKQNVTGVTSPNRKLALGITAAFAIGYFAPEIAIVALMNPIDTIDFISALVSGQPTTSASYGAVLGAWGNAGLQKGGVMP